MARVKVSKNLYRGCRVESMGEVELLAMNRESIAWQRGDGSYLVRPAQYFAKWGEGILVSRLDFLYHTTPYRSFWTWLKEKLCKKS